MVERPRGGDLIVQRMSGMVLRSNFPRSSRTSGSESGSSYHGLSRMDINDVKLLHWELSDHDLDVNYIVHAVKKPSENEDGQDDHP